MTQDLKLFEETREAVQILPRDGEAIYYGPIIDAASADVLLQYFLEKIPWKNDEGMIYGKRYVTERKIAWFGDQRFEYAYSGKTKVGLPWTPELLALKEKTEKLTGSEYNSCLLNLYQNGGQGLGWHSDDESEIRPHSPIASVSFGAERRFDFQHKVTREKISVFLEHGSLLVMAGSTQEHWKHQLPKALRIRTPRVNLTFRSMTLS